MSSWRSLLFVTAALLAFLGPANSQTTFASLTGAVTDSSGAVVAGAKITATNLETNIQTTAESNEAGHYNIAQLKEGAYTLRAQARGFKEFVAQNIVLVSRDIRRLDVTLEVGSVETTVEVLADRKSVV